MTETEIIWKLQARIQELEADIATLDQENRQLNARNARLQKEIQEMAMDNLVAFEQSLDGRNH